MTNTDHTKQLADALEKIGERLRTQDNRCTAQPMFCVQVKKRDVGYDTNYADGQTVWVDMESGDYDEVPPGTKGAEEFGYVERWETVMVAFTEEGCKEHLELNGHNYRGETRIYAESFHRCPEMVAIREALMSGMFAAYRAQEGEAKVLPGVQATGLTGRWNVAFTLASGTSRSDLCATEVDLIRSIVHGVGLTGKVEITQLAGRPITPEGQP